MKNTKVMILRGLPGSGKDTFIKALAKTDDLKIVTCSADHYFMETGEYEFNPDGLTAAHEQCFRRFVTLCQGVCYPDNDLDIIAVSNTNAMLFEIAPYLTYARYERLPIEIVEVSIPDATPQAHAEQNIHGVPVAVIENMVKWWEQMPPFWPLATRIESHLGKFTIIDAKNGSDRTIPLRK